MMEATISGRGSLDESREAGGGRLQNQPALTTSCPSVAWPQLFHLEWIDPLYAYNAMQPIGQRHQTVVEADATES